MSKLLSRKSKQPEGKTWLHAPEAFTQGSVVYSLKLRGFTEVSQAKGTDVVREAITKVKFANHIKKSEAGIKASKLRKVDLKVSVDSVKIEDTKTKEELHTYPLHRISYCADDKRDKKLFAFIAKNKDSPQHLCFVLESDRLAEELTLTVGQAFDIAYRRFLERKGKQDLDTQKQLNNMQEQIKAAEAEKEALKQKIAQLEIGASRETAQTNVNVVQMKTEKTSNNNSNLLGDFGSGFNSNTTSSKLQEPNEGLFDPLEFPGTSQGETPKTAKFDPFAEYAVPHKPATQSPSQPAAKTPPPVRTNPFAAQTETAAASAANPQAVALPRPKSSSSQAASFSLPPPPTKQSIKASQQQVKMGGTTMPAPTSAAPQPSSSEELLSIESNGFTAESNPFPTDPFQDIFDPLDAEPTSNGMSGNGFQEMQEGFSRGLVIDHNVFSTDA